MVQIRPKVVSYFKDTFNRYIGTGKMQLIFSLLFIATLPFIAMFLQKYGDIVELRRKERPDYPWPEYSELWIAVYSCMVMIGLNLAFKRCFFGYAGRLLKDKYKGDERENRQKRMVDCMLKTVYFCVAAVAGYCVAKNADFLPPAMGGGGVSSNIHVDFPFQSFEKLPYLKEYIMMQLGYHLHSLILHVAKPPRNDFMEMLLHHVMTVFLIGLAYFMNYHVYSILVLIAHDIPDVFVCLAKMFVDTKYTTAALISCTLMVTSWAHLRLCAFPAHVIWNCFYDNPIYDETYGVSLLSSMLHILLVLDTYWFFLFMKMGYHFAVKKEAQDLQQKLE